MLYQLPPEKGTPPHPIFGPCMLWPNGWMVQHATHLVQTSTSAQATLYYTGSAALRERGTAVPSFRPMSIVSTVAHLSYC